MATSVVLAAVQADVDARIPGVTWRTGKRFLTENVPAPRVVWVPMADSYAGAMKGGTNPRALRTRAAGFVAHVWAATLDATEALVHAVVAGLHRTAHGSYEITTGDWTGTDWLTSGEACELAFVLRVPVTDDPAPVVRLESVGSDAAGATSGDGVLETGDA